MRLQLSHRAKKAFPFVLLLIITIPAILSLLNNYYFTMHDDQHIARLFLLNQGIRQGNLYPRWVDQLGFGFGYPLFNFYPPLIYYVSEFFHLIGFSFITSTKLMIITGFIVGAMGMYLLAKRFVGKAAAILSTTLYTFFTYHAVLVYVRGAFAEFFALSILPFVFLTFDALFRKPTLNNAAVFGISFALLILAHPLIALPTLMYIAIFLLTYLVSSHSGKERPDTSEIFSAFHILCGFLLALGLSAFFWLPSMIERKYTMVDSILLKSLANYKLHFVYPHQFWYSQWGYGGSIAGPADGLSFQLGKIHLFFALGAFLLSIIYTLSFWRAKGVQNLVKADSGQARVTEDVSFANKITYAKFFYFFLLLFLFSLFMSTSYSGFIWSRLQFLWYLQFPWRFLTFAAIFISLCGGFVVFFVSHIFKQLNTEKILAVMAIGTSLIVMFQYHKYFKPQRFLQTSDTERTSYEEIAWRISRTSFEFVPKGVATKKSELGTTILDISQKDIPQKSYEVISGETTVNVVKNNFREKAFTVRAQTPIIFRLNTFNFPGWQARVDNKRVVIKSGNNLLLSTITVPKGFHEIEFLFTDTLPRLLGNALSFIASIITLTILLKSKIGRQTVNILFNIAHFLSKG